MLPLDDHATYYRKEAAACMAVAQRMSLLADKQRMVDLAMHWFGLAQTYALRGAGHDRLDTASGRLSAGTSG